MCAQMYQKAILFRDHEIAQQILMTDTPLAAKRLGRAVRGFDPKVWGAKCEDVVLRACLMKFHQNPAFRSFLLGLGNSAIAEASPRDRIWGIGMGQTNPLAKDPTKWKGANLLGRVLMRTRAALRAIDQDTIDWVTVVDQTQPSTTDASNPPPPPVTDAAARESAGSTTSERCIRAGIVSGSASLVESDSKLYSSSDKIPKELSQADADLALARSLGVISLAERSARLKVVVGDLLDLSCSGVEHIAHQCNCLTRRYKGLAHTMYKQYPNAEPYSSGALVPYGGKPHPGLVLICDPVVNMFAQYRPGGAQLKAAGGAGSADPADTAEGRLGWFQMCLDTILEDKTIKSIAFPMNIGCGLAGGAWVHYEALLVKFSDAMLQDGGRRVVVVRQAKWW
jgi:ribA/ribD-fused uncharacterized protein